MRGSLPTAFASETPVLAMNGRLPLAEGLSQWTPQSMYRDCMKGRSPNNQLL